MKDLFNAIFKRKSVRKFDNKNKLSDQELQQVESVLQNLEPLCPQIATKIVVVPAEQTNCKFNAEYCVLCYSQIAPLCLENIGYMMEQWDLAMADMGIGVCWYGMGEAPQQELDGLTYMVMLCFGKCDASEFRTSTKQFLRNNVDEFWNGIKNDTLSQVVRLCPSACNSQPWRIECDGSTIYVLQEKELESPLGKRLSVYFNRMDMGIFLAIWEITLEHFGYAFQRVLEEGTTPPLLWQTAQAVKLIDSKTNPLELVATYQTSKR